MGILPFLVQWVALGFFGMKTFAPSSPFGQQPYYPTGHSMPPKSHWTLLAEFQNLPEEEIETFLPQICNMVLDQESLNDPAIFDYLERIILGKCAQCLPFGMRVCGVLRVSGTFEAYFEMSSSSFHFILGCFCGSIGRSLQRHAYQYSADATQARSIENLYREG